MMKNLQALTGYGIHFHPAAELIGPANSAKIAMDAAGPLVTVGNNGIPAMLTNYVDPKIIEILIAPINATEIFDEVHMGDMATDTATFMTVERTGGTSAYGDYSQNGRSGHNVNFPQRQNYGYQTITEWGDKQLEKAGKARMNYAGLQQQAAATILRKKENDVYLYGVSGLQNYGVLNDPGLPSAATPSTGVAGNTWALKTADEIYNGDIVGKLYINLVTQTKGLVNSKTKMKLVLSPEVDAQLSKQNAYGQVLRDRIKLAYPNIEFVTVPQYNTGSGQLVQLIAPELEGLPTGNMAYAEKLRAHGVVRGLSAFKEKKSGHAWGAVIYRPFAISQLLGV
jgi:hypothetical protein